MKHDDTEDTKRNWDNLPKHILTDLFSRFLYSPVFIYCGRVNQRWQSIFNGVVVMYPLVNPLQERTIHPDLPKLLARFQNLLTLDLSITNVDATIISLLPEELPHLENLLLFCCMGITDECIPLMTQLRHLKTLVLSYSQITQESIHHVANLTSLQNLEIEMCFRIENISPLTSLQHLHSLNINSCVNLAPDSVLPLFPSLSHLTSLRLNNLISDDVLVELPNRAPWVEKIDLANCLQIGVRGIEGLSKLESLKELSLRNCKQLGDEVLVALSNLTSLTSLDSMNCNFTPSEFHNCFDSRKKLLTADHVTLQIIESLKD
eukprot:TRINITY_DN18595_c0_g1_i1.p1 TRINITY_DN18595_c0_g1~~TRINITY_DN18595_c0_g1_i1.p1  ORF type:complete len:331 (+),score=34.16 TRINITY_DN18595_c0_g1_i1:37-993(+)